jgi:hypothetical protein
MQLTYSALQWDTLAQTQRVRVLVAAKLPTALASSRWSQLTISEQSALYCLDWFRVLQN